MWFEILPWTEEQLRKLPPFEFENWAVIAIGGMPNRSKVGDMGIDGRIYPISSIPAGRGHEDQFAFMDEWFPVQVKQKDKVGRPDIDSFEAVMSRENRTRGFIVGFGFTSDAQREIDRFETRTGRTILALTVAELLAHEQSELGRKKPPMTERTLDASARVRAG